MKKLFFLIFAFAFQSMLANNSYYDVAINGIYYRLNNDSKEATVVMGCTEREPYSGYNNPVSVASYKGDVIIPDTIAYNDILYAVTSLEGQNRGLDVIVSYGAFESCKDLTSITIPKTIKTIGNQTFAGCTSLKSVYISDLYAWCNIDFGLYGRYGTYCPNTNPLYYAHDLYLNNVKIENLIVPENISAIKRGSFIGCSASAVSFHRNISEIYEYAFDDCINLQDIYSYSPKINLASTEAEFTFFEEPENKTLHIRERFSDNYAEMPWKMIGSVQYITNYDFYLKYLIDGEVYKEYLYGVGDVVTPEIAPTKNGYTFDGWSDIPETMPDHDVTVTGSFTPNTYKLSYYVDGELYKAVDVKCDDSVEAEPYPSKEGYSFSGWDGIPETMPARNVNVYGTFSINKYKLTFIVDDVEYASYQIDYGSATRIPESIPQKENYEFINWSEIPETMPARNITSTALFKKVSTDIDGIKYKYVGDDAYVIGNDKSGVVKVLSSFEEDGNTYTVTAIEKNAFRNNTNITSIEVPNTIVAINDSAFFGCRNLTNVDLGNSVRTIGERAFANIDKLTDVVCHAEEVPDADRTSFENSYLDYVTLHVPAVSVEKYKAASPWKGFKEIVPIEGVNPTRIVTIHSVEGKKATYNLNGININKANKAAKGIIIRDGKKYYFR